MIKNILAASALVLVAGQASAIVKDFETGFAGDVTDLGTDYTLGAGLSAIDFSVSDVVPVADDNLTVIKVGSPTDGFVTKDDPKPSGIFGEYFLSSEFLDDAHVSMTFQKGVTDLSFQLADIDGVQDGAPESLTITAFLGGGATKTVSITAGAGVTSGEAGWVSGPIGKNQVTSFDLSGEQVYRVEMYMTTPAGDRDIGWGIDNISYVVPLPAGMWLMGTALAGLGLASRRRRKS